jgi:hypothetical protein
MRERTQAWDRSYSSSEISPNSTYRFLVTACPPVVERWLDCHKAFLSGFFFIAMFSFEVRRWRWQMRCQR